MAIEPDTKDWTWVLGRPCEECGFNADSVGTDVLAEKLRDGATRWSAVLSREDVRIRPSENQWSPLEYACHVRDVFLVFYGRLVLMLENDRPTFENWDQDETAIKGRYCDQDPAEVRDEICASARLAIRVKRLEVLRRTDHLLFELTLGHVCAGIHFQRLDPLVKRAPGRFDRHPGVALPASTSPAGD